VAVQRCPNCGRSWDGASCFACGYEAGQPVAGLGPQRTSTPSPSLAPTPPPSVVDANPFAPKAARPAPQRPASPAPVPAAPAAPAVVVPPVAPPSPTLPAWEEAADLPRRATPDPFQSRPTQQLPRRQKNDTTPAPVVQDEAPRGLALRVGLLVATFALVAGIGSYFVVRQTPEKLLAKGDYVGCLALLAQQPELRGQDLLVKGAAHAGRGESTEMLQAYQAAVTSGASSPTALQDVAAALGDRKLSSTAQVVLRDWPDVEPTLLKLVTDPNWQRRAGALRVLIDRKKLSADVLAKAEVDVAVADLRSSTCEQKQAGLRSIQSLLAKPTSHPALRAGQAWNAVYAMNSEAVLAELPCLDRKEVQEIERVLATIEGGKH
jgi:hypothetical protein